MGATVTEMTRTFHHQPFRLEDHIARLFRSLKYTRMETGLTPESLLSISRELLAHNAGLIKPEEELGLIHFVTAGENSVYAGSAAWKKAPPRCGWGAPSSARDPVFEKARGRVSRPREE